MDNLLNKKIKLTPMFRWHAPQSNNNSGFTLIELLVVIAIIGLLSTISIVALNSTRSRARDARRLSDMSQISKALDMYYNDMGVYPNCWGGSGGKDSGWYTCLEPALSPYMRKLPHDPLEKGNGYYYRISPHAGQGAQLVFYLENVNPNLSNASFSWYTGEYGYAVIQEVGQYSRVTTYGY